MQIRIRYYTSSGSGTPCPQYSDLAAHLCWRYVVFLSNVLDDGLVQARHILPKKKHYSVWKFVFIMQVRIGIPFF
jgi:hypothetical protein